MKISSTEQKAKAILETPGAIEWAAAGGYCNVKNGSSRHTVTVMHDGRLRCSCTYEEFNPLKEKCSHAQAVRMSLNAKRQETA